MSDELLMPGCEHLQRHYAVKRDDEEKLIPVESMTLDELRAKAAAFRKHADEHLKHAEELERQAGDLEDG